MKKIIAVVVTYNRITLLKECVYALLHQKDCTDTQLDILLVDNASDDGTKEWIEEQIAHTESHDTTPIYALHLSENTGGAGGFYYGMKWAYEHGADAIWIMDDDTIPKEDALQKLWEGMAHVRKQMAPKSEIGFVSSTVLCGRCVFYIWQGCRRKRLGSTAGRQCYFCITSVLKGSSRKNGTSDQRVFHLGR